MLVKFAIHDFIEEKRFINVTDITITNYRVDLGYFHEYLTRIGIENVEEITYNHVRGYFMECMDKGNQAGTINTKLLRIKTFLNYMVECKIIQDSPAKKIKRQLTDSHINVFTDEQIQQMMSYFRRRRQRDGSYHMYRDHMIIVFLLGTGARRAELINVKWSDIDFIHGNITLYGKGRTRVSIPATDKLIKELGSFKAYLERYHNGKQLDHIFTGSNNKPMTINGISMMFRYLREKMNFKDVRLSCHTFRHTFAHRLVMSGASPFLVQKLMRHTNITTTMTYINLWGQDLRQGNDEHNPLNDMDI